jgi:hypothetical protein
MKLIGMFAILAALGVILVLPATAAVGTVSQSQTKSKKPAGHFVPMHPHTSRDRTDSRSVGYRACLVEQGPERVQKPEGGNERRPLAPQGAFFAWPRSCTWLDRLGDTGTLDGRSRGCRDEHVAVTFV